MTPDEYCRDRAAASGSSFYYSFLFLPPAQRSAITALYAYCREIDDAVDEVSDSAVAGAKIDWWQAEVERLFAGTPQHPVTRALEPHVATYGLTSERMLLVLDGMRIDLAQNRFLDFPSLARYCYLVAGVVGEMAAGIFGSSGEATYSYARQLGLALQMVNILRDVGEDARRGRIYLPLDDMQRFGVKAADILAGRYVKGFGALMNFEAERARQAFAVALSQLPPADYRAQRPGIIMAAIYARLLDELAREHFRVLHQHISLTPIRKLSVAWRTWVFGPPARMQQAASSGDQQVGSGADH
ncbi:MAG TPA: presqualene diphosphate synthase HpnD [Burkholderiaceae bacterium]|nr:presqualene diphosphate synthase HpnD [Burkholderiaceae bacterium]